MKTVLLAFFAPIKNPKLKTELNVKVREAKVINQLKKDKQAFGLLVAKEISPEEVYSKPTNNTSLCIKRSFWQAPAKSKSTVLKLLD